MTDLDDLSDLLGGDTPAPEKPKRGPGRPKKVVAPEPAEQIVEAPEVVSPVEEVSQVVEDFHNDAEAQVDLAKYRENPNDLLKDDAPSFEELKTDVEEDAAAKRIRELEDELLKPSDYTGRPLPEAELSESQKKIRELEDRLAKKKAAEFEFGEQDYDKVEGDSILIHFVADGFTAQGENWYRGQELEFGKNSVAFKQTFNRLGESWVLYTEEQQLVNYGEVKFRRGPWPGLPYEDGSVAEKERRRNRAAPVIKDK